MNTEIYNELTELERKLTVEFGRRTAQEIIMYIIYGHSVDSAIQTVLETGGVMQ